MVNKLGSVKVEILLATYNGQKFVADQIDSIIKQTHSNWTIIARDDGSTDGTHAILKAYQSRYGSKILIVEDEFCNIGPMNNFEQLMKYSKGQYIMFCDQDDIWYPNKVNEMLEALVKLENKLPKETPILVHSDLEVVDSDLNTVDKSMFKYQRLNKKPTYKERLVRNNITGCASMLNRPALKVSLPIPVEAVMHDWWVALCVVRYGGQVQFLDKPLLKYRQHMSNSIGATKVGFTYYFRKFFKLGFFFKSLHRVYRQANIVNKITPFQFLILKLRFLFRL